MLPRNGKNCIKVSISNDEDEEDLLLKLEEARQGQSSTQLLRSRDEEKMDI